MPQRTTTWYKPTVDLCCVSVCLCLSQVCFKRCTVPHTDKATAQCVKSFYELRLLRAGLAFRLRSRVGEVHLMMGVYTYSLFKVQTRGRRADRHVDTQFDTHTRTDTQTVEQETDEQKNRRTKRRRTGIQTKTSSFDGQPQKSKELMAVSIIMNDHSSGMAKTLSSPTCTTHNGDKSVVKRLIVVYVSSSEHMLLYSIR